MSQLRTTEAVGPFPRLTNKMSLLVSLLEQLPDPKVGTVLPLPCHSYPQSLESTCPDMSGWRTTEEVRPSSRITGKMPMHVVLLEKLPDH